MDFILGVFIGGAAVGFIWHFWPQVQQEETKVAADVKAKIDAKL